MRKLFTYALSLIVAMMMFAPTAGWTEQAHAADTASQFEELKRKGILQGFEDGSAGLERRMSRAEFAAALVRLLKLKPQSGASSYEDTLFHWAHQQGYIEAVKASRLMEGTTERLFGPDENVTLEQLAATLVRGLHLSPKLGVQVKGRASEWAVGYVAAALEEKLLGEYPDYTQAATRDALTAALYAADGRLAALPAFASEAVSILEFEAAGAKKLRVKLNQPVNAEKLTFEVSREGTPVKGETAFGEDRQTVDVSFESPLEAGTYSVEMKGAEAVNIGQAEAVTEVEHERLEKLEFVTASDTLPKANQVYVEFSARNQYGETSAWNASQFDIQTGSVSYTAVSGKQAIKLDLEDRDKGSQISVSIHQTDYALSVQKTFTVGDLPVVTSIEAGDLLIPGELKKLNEGADAYLRVKAFDQYGVPVLAVEEANEDNRKYGLNTSAGILVAAKDRSILLVSEDPWHDYDNDGIPELKVTGGSDADQVRESEVTLYALGSGQSITKQIPLTVTRAPFSVQFGELKKVVAEGDTDVILPLIVKDDQGQALSSNEVAEGIKQLNVHDTFGSAAKVKLEDQGNYRGLLVISGRKEGSGEVTVQIAGTDKKASLRINVQEERYPAQFSIKTELARYYLPEAEESLVLLIRDQYGELIRDPSNTYISVLADSSDATKVRSDAVYKIHAVYENLGDASENGALYPTSGPLKTAIDALRAVDPPSAGEREQYTIDEAFMQSAQSNVKGFNIGNIHNIKMMFKADSKKTGAYRITLKLVKIKENNGVTKVEELDVLSRTVGVIDGSDNDIAYEVRLDTAVNNTLFAAVEAYREGGTESTVTASAYGLVKDRVKLAKEVVLDGKKNGQAVEVPLSWMFSPLGSVTSSNDTVATAVYINSGTAAAPLYKYFVIGDEEGTATMSFVYQTRAGAKGISRIHVNTSEQHPEITRTAGGKAYAKIEHTKISGKKMWDFALMGEVSLTDSYGSAYKNDVMATHVKALGLSFYATDIVYKAADGNDTVTVNPDTGTVTYTGDGDIASFTLVIAAPNGKKVQTIVNLP